MLLRLFHVEQFQRFTVFCYVTSLPWHTGLGRAFCFGYESLQNVMIISVSLICLFFNRVESHNVIYDDFIIFIFVIDLGLYNDRIYIIHK